MAWTLVATIKGNAGTNGSNGVGVPTGGPTGAFLIKSSASDYDTQWTAFYTGTPAPPGDAYTGSSLQPSRGDHVHAGARGVLAFNERANTRAWRPLRRPW